MPSNKSTPEEIAKKAKEALEAKETPDDDKTPEDEKSETPEGEEETPTTGKEDDESPEGEEGDEGEGEGEESEDEGEGEEEDQGKKQKPPIQTPPVEERYNNQRRENIVLHAKQKKLTETVEQAAKLPDPTEDELKTEYPEWDEMTDTEKRFAKENLINKRRFSMIHGAVTEGQELDVWNEKVDKFLVTGVTKFPRLSGKEDGFKDFCSKPSRVGLDFEDLVKAFLFDATETPTRKRGSLLETGTGGGGQKGDQGNFIDEKQAATLRTKNHKLYQKLVREGKIKIQL